MGKIKIGSGSNIVNAVPELSIKPSLDDMLTKVTPPVPVELKCDCKDELSNIKMDIELLKRIEPIVVKKNQPIQICPVLIDSRVRKYTKALRQELLRFQEDAFSTLRLVSLKLEKSDERLKELESRKPEEHNIHTQDYHTETIREIQYVLDKKVLVAASILGIINAILIITLINK